MPFLSQCDRIYGMLNLEFLVCLFLNIIFLGEIERKFRDYLEVRRKYREIDRREKNGR